MTLKAQKKPRISKLPGSPENYRKSGKILKANVATYHNSQKLL